MKNYSRFVFFVLSFLLIACNTLDYWTQDLEVNPNLESSSVSSSNLYFASGIVNGKSWNARYFGSTIDLDSLGEVKKGFGITFYSGDTLQYQTGIYLRLNIDEVDNLKGEFNLFKNDNSWFTYEKFISNEYVYYEQFQKYNYLLDDEINYFIIDSFAADSSFIEGRMELTMTHSLNLDPDYAKNRKLKEPYNVLKIRDFKFRIPFKDFANSPFVINGTWRLNQSNKLVYKKMKLSDNQ